MVTTATPSGRVRTGVAVVGFGVLAGAVLLAHRSPATGYELSIYAATPPSFWIGVAVAFLAGALLSFTDGSDAHRRLGLLLGGLASVAVFTLPVIRGYRFLGVNDAVTHVGIVRELTAGSMLPFDTVYPAIHSLAAFLAGATGISIWHATLLVPMVAAVAFVVFVPLVVRAVAGTESAGTVGAFAAFLLVPLHQTAATLNAHPSSQAILLTPLALFLLVAYLRSPDLTGIAVPTTVALLVAVAAVILYHPQQALNILLLLAVVLLVQGAVRIGLRRREGSDARWGGHRSVLPVFVVSVVLYAVWVAQFSAVATVVEGAIASTVALLTGSGGTVGEAIGSQAASVRSIGSSPLVLAAKLFGVSSLFVLASALAVVVLGRRSGRLADVPDARRITVYLVGGGVLMSGVLALYLVGNVGQYYFRQAAFLMMIATVLGAVGLTYAARWLAERRLGSATVAVAFCLLFVLSALVLFNSPYIHRANQHVTDARVDGYATTFEVTPEDAVLGGIGQEPQRYYEALVDMSNNGRRDALVNSSDIGRLQQRPDDDWYLVIGRNTYERELRAYRELRFSREEFASLARQPGVARVHANGDTELYYVP